MTALTPPAIPRYVAGTWDIDAKHSTVAFSGHLVTGADLLDSSGTVEIDVNSVDTGNAQRDEHVRSADFLHAADFLTMTYRSRPISARTPDADQRLTTAVNL